MMHGSAAWPCRWTPSCPQCRYTVHIRNRFPVSPEWRSVPRPLSAPPAYRAGSEPHLAFCRDRQCTPVGRTLLQQRIFFCHPSVSTFIIASNRLRQTHRVCTRTKATRNLYSWEYNSQAHLPKLYQIAYILSRIPPSHKPWMIPLLLHSIQFLRTSCADA